MKSRRLFALAAPAAWLVGASIAHAQEPPECPPDEWFCEDAPSEEDGVAGDAPSEPLPPADYAVPEPAPEAGLPGVATQDALELGWSEGSGRRGASPWALALRIEGVLLESSSRADAGLGGLGVSGRYELNRVITLDLGLDSILGTDYNGFERSELALSLSSLFFLNDHSLVRTYLLAGLNTSAARVDVLGDDQTWGYLGLQGGLGLDIRLDPLLALNIDILAFMRGRLDSRAAREPEFIDSSGRVSNTSGGGMLRGGVVLHF